MHPYHTPPTAGPATALLWLGRVSPEVFAAYCDLLRAWGKR